jgi:glutamine amidotransferase-like uncharacterized protein
MSWITDIFRAGAANKGGIVRRSKKTVLANGGYKALRAEVKRRSFHMLRTGGQYVIICNRGYFRTLV